MKSGKTKTKRNINNLGGGCAWLACSQDKPLVMILLTHARFMVSPMGYTESH